MSKKARRRLDDALRRTYHESILLVGSGRSIQPGHHTRTTFGAKSVRGRGLVSLAALAPAGHQYSTIHSRMLKKAR